MLKSLTVVLLTLSLIGCSSTMTPRPDVGGVEPVIQSPAEQLLHNRLLEQYADWQGTRYRFGGLSKQGVDCSGLVYLTYRNKLGTPIPRTTKLQSRLGAEVGRSELRVGDLVFFKTGIRTRHVGISLGGSRFLHASESRGVTISSLDNRYWSSKYWMAKRVID